MRPKPETIVNLSVIEYSFSKKQINSIKKWEENNPNWENSEEGTKNYFQMVQLLTDPVNEEQENKIIKGIAKEVIIKN